MRKSDYSFKILLQAEHMNVERELLRFLESRAYLISVLPGILRIVCVYLVLNKLFIAYNFKLPTRLLKWAGSQSHSVYYQEYTAHTLLQ